MLLDHRDSDCSVLSADAGCWILDPPAPQERPESTQIGTDAHRRSHLCDLQVNGWMGGIENQASRIESSESAARFYVLTIVSPMMTSTSRLSGEELPRSSLDPGDSLVKVGIMAGIIGRSILDGGRKSARTRWACRRPLKPSGLPRSDTSRDLRLITTWRSIHTQYACPKIETFMGFQCVRMARHGVAVSAWSNREA
jgi:hypothetical protein